MKLFFNSVDNSLEEKAAKKVFYIDASKEHSTTIEELSEYVDFLSEDDEIEVITVYNII